MRVWITRGKHTLAKGVLDRCTWTWDMNRGMGPVLCITACEEDQEGSRIPFNKSATVRIHQ